MKKTIRGLIYLCEDDPGIQLVVQEVLEDAGFAVIIFDHAGEMLKKAITAPPNLLIVDWWLPVVGGEKVVRSWRADKKTKDVPCLVISAAGEIRGEAVACGASSFLAKPFNISELITVVNKLTISQNSVQNNAED